jgi:hypothetical protein
VGVWSRYQDVDIERQRYRRCGPPVYVYDHGPVMPSAPSRAAMRTYQREFDEWLRATGGKPYRVALNSADSAEWIQRSHGRFSRSATEREPVHIEPRVVTGSIINMDATNTLPAWLIYDIISNSYFLVPIIDARDRWLEADNRYQRAFF